MKAAVYPGSGKPLTIETLPDPEPGPDDVILKVHRCGICGTDLHMTAGHTWQFPAGTVPGHEYAGEIVEIGSNVTAYKKGDRITALPSTGCGHCVGCIEGNLTLCTNSPGVLGGFGEYLRVPAAVAIKLPDALSMADGALIEPLAVGLYGLRAARIAAGDKVLVIGAGSVALSAIYWARRMGAGKIVTISRAQSRAAMALAMGSDAFVQESANEVGEVIEALGGQPDIVLECVGAPGLIARAIQHVRPLGQVVALGFCTEPDSFIPALAGRKGVSIRFSIGYTLNDFHHAADVMDKGHVDPKILITSQVSLADLPTRLEKLRLPNTETKVQLVLA
jgi:(R,R)-butanediol dehydrogenase/meso-butanediol dehydrogenase/diacetyl reductase